MSTYHQIRKNEELKLLWSERAIGSEPPASKSIHSLARVASGAPGGAVDPFEIEAARNIYNW